MFVPLCFIVMQLSNFHREIVGVSKCVVVISVDMFGSYFVDGSVSVILSWWQS
jgi:hypothetical protein